MRKLIKNLFGEGKAPSSWSTVPRPVVLLDVGARGGVQWPWTTLPPQMRSVVCVEPDPAEAARLQQNFAANGGGTVLPTALWRRDETLTLNLTRSPGSSSVFAPARELLTQFPESDRFDVMQSFDVRARSIDSLAAAGEMPNVDFAKLDTQGAELAILEGGVQQLSRDLVGVEIEVEFARMYADQPLFGDVDAFVREKLGLELWDIRKTYWKYKDGVAAAGPTKGRLVFGDALYFRPLHGLDAWLDSMSREQAAEKVVMLALSAWVYGYTDYALAVLSSKAAQRFIDARVTQQMQSDLRSRGNGFRPFRAGNGYLYFLLDGLARAFKPTHGGWASVEYHLGSRRRGPFWY